MLGCIAAATLAAHLPRRSFRSHSFIHLLYSHMLRALCARAEPFVCKTMRTLSPRGSIGKN